MTTNATPVVDGSFVVANVVVGRTAMAPSTQATKIIDPKSLRNYAKDQLV